MMDKGVFRFLRGFVVCFGVFTCLPPAFAQGYPNQRIEVVVANPPGGGTDVVGRVLSESLQKQLGQPVIVVNKPGASTSIGLTDVARSKPDGYKLVILLAEAGYISALGIGKVSNDDFEPIARFTEDPASVTVRADAPWKTIEEFLAYARANPEQIKVSNSGTGGIWHLAAAALEEKSRTKFLHVPYQGSAPAFMALLGGQVDATTVSPGEMSQHIKSGTLKVLGVMSTKRVSSFPLVPTLVERGVDVNISVFRGLGAPKGTPSSVLDILKSASLKASEDPVLRSRLDAQALNFDYADSNGFSQALSLSAGTLRPLASKLALTN